jgi:hypothetical protein
VYRQKLRECFSRGVGCGRGQPKVNDECLTDAKQNAERRIEERFRFLLERDSNTSILRSFRITDISAPIFPNTNARSAAVSLDEHQLRTVFLAVAVWLSASRSSSLNLRRRGHPPMLCDGRPPSFSCHAVPFREQVGVVYYPKNGNSGSRNGASDSASD